MIEDALKILDNPEVYEELDEKNKSEDFYRGYGYAVSLLLSVKDGD